MTTIKKFKWAWYAAHVSHDPNYDRDRKASNWRETVLTARTWAAISSRAAGRWQIAADNRCLPSQL